MIIANFRFIVNIIVSLITVEGGGSEIHYLFWRYAKVALIAFNSSNTNN